MLSRSSMPWPPGPTGTELFLSGSPVALCSAYAFVGIIDSTLYPVAKEAMRRGYYVPNRGSIHCSRHQCPHWRRCEQDFGGVVEP